jgi:hypothetical protein
MFKWLLGHLGLNAVPLSDNQQRWNALQTRMIETPALSCSLTACEAYAIVEPHVLAYDQAAKLIAITSGEDISHTGHSNQWELFFDLPNARAHVIYSYVLELAEDAATGVEQEQRQLVEKITPFPHPNSTMAQMLGAGALKEQAVADQWAKQLARHSALPVPFRDSPDVVALFAQRGKISSRVILTLRFSRRGYPTAKPYGSR